MIMAMDSTRIRVVFINNIRKTNNSRKIQSFIKTIFKSNEDVIEQHKMREREGHKCTLFKFFIIQY